MSVVINFPAAGGGGGSGGGITTLAAATDYNTNLVTPLASKLSNALAWDGTTPNLQSGVNPVPAFGSNCFVYTGAGGAVLDGQTYATGDLTIWGEGGASVFSKISTGGAYLGIYANTGVLPTAATNTGNFALVGASAPYTYYYSNGSAWATFAGGGSIAATTLPVKGDGAGNAVAAVSNVDYAAPPILQFDGPGVYIAPTGTVGSNGALTLGTALSAASTAAFTRGVFLYFPANSITGANAAGFYWTVFTTTTAGTIFNNVYTPGTNTGAGSWHIPGSTTAFSGTTGGAYTGVTTAVVAFSNTIAANSMGAHGYIRTEVGYSNFNSAGSKSVSQQLATLNIGYSNSVTTSTYTKAFAIIKNLGETGQQYSPPANYTTSTGVGQTRAIDTTLAQTLTTSLTLAVATDYIGITELVITTNFAA